MKANRKVITRTVNQTSTKKINIALERLEARFGRQTRFSSKPPLDRLIATILSQRTNYENERKAFERMWKQFGSWEGIMNAPVDQLTEAITTSNYPEVKAPRIKATLRRIYEERGNFDLSFLADVPVKEAMDWLMQFEGVGHKTATFLLLFTFRKPVLPVDTHVHRTGSRNDWALLTKRPIRRKPTQCYWIYCPKMPTNYLITTNYFSSTVSRYVPGAIRAAKIVS